MSLADLNINFMGRRKLAGIISICLVVGAIVSMAVQGLNLGLDFTGGTLVEVEFEAPKDPEDVRRTLEAAGYENGVVQYFGTNRDLLIRMPPQLDVDQSVLGDRILATLRGEDPNIRMRQSNYVCPAVG